MENISKDLVLLVLLLIELYLRVHIVVSTKMSDNMIDFKVIFELYDSMSIRKGFPICCDNMYLVISTRLISNDNIVFMLFSNLLNINFNKNKGAKPQFGLGVFILGRQL